MTKQEVIDIIKAAAERYGFTTGKYSMTWVIEIMEPEGTHYLNFFVRERREKEIDWSNGEIKMKLLFSANLASMGGETTPEELLNAADIIRKGAELVRELQNMNLSYTDKI